MEDHRLSPDRRLELPGLLQSDPPEHAEINSSQLTCPSIQGHALLPCGDCSHISAGHRLSRVASALAATAIACAVVLPPAQAVARASAKTLACRASVSNAHPSEYSTTTVFVETVAKARVTTSAHYRTTTNTQSAKANSHGLAAINYDVSDATEGFKVIVTVQVQSGSRSGRCQTSYVPG